ncbi:MAG: VWA domain-containing protein [Thermomicrobiales bacterium]
MSHTHPNSSSRLQVSAHWLRPLLPAAGGEATLLIRLATTPDPAAERAAPLDVAFVLDRSGSMSGPKLTLAKEGVQLAMQRLRPVDRVALVIYDDSVEVMQPLAAATPRLLTSLQRALSRLQSGGSTALFGGWVAGCGELANAPAGDGAQTRIRRTILLTDGLANVGPRDPGELAQHAGQLRQRGIATTTVGVGLDYDEGLLSAMAEAGGGNFKYAESPQVLRTFFAEELQQMLSIAAATTTLHLTLPQGVRGRLVSAFPVTRDGKTLKIAIGDLPDGETVDLVFTLRGVPGEVGDTLPVQASCHWTDPATDQRHRWDVSPSPLWRATREELAATRSEPWVEERVALQLAAAERREALELDRAGRFRESRAKMAMSVDYLMAAPDTDEVQELRRESGELAAAPPTAAYDSHTRKSAQYREHQRRHNRPTRPADEPR